MMELGDSSPIELGNNPMLNPGGREIILIGVFIKHPQRKDYLLPDLEEARNIFDQLQTNNTYKGSRKTAQKLIDLF
jgi:NADH:ubiquinone oxidoreductase subunit C